MYPTGEKHVEHAPISNASPALEVPSVAPDALGHIARRESAVQNIPIAAVLIDAEQQIIEANLRFVDSFGGGNVIGRRLCDALPPCSAGTNHPWATASRGPTGWSHRKIRVNDGRWYLQRTIPVADAASDGTRAIVTFTPMESTTVLGDRMKLLASSTEVVWWWDWDFDTGTISFEFDELAAPPFKVGAIPHTGPEFLALIHPDDLLKVQMEIEDCMAGRIHQWTCEHRIRLADDGWRWALSSGRLSHLDALGRATRMVGITIDNHEKRTIADHVRRDVQILAQLRDAVVCLDLQGRILFWNDAATRKFGWTKEEMLGNAFCDHIVDPQRAQHIEHVLRGVLAGEAVTGEQQTLRKDGTPIWIEFSWSIFHDTAGLTAGIVGVARDISYRKEAQSCLERDAAILRGLNEIVLVCGADSRIHFVNDALERVLAWNKRAAIGQPCTFRFPPHDREPVNQFRRRVLDEGSVTVEWEDYRSDGSRLWMEWRGQRLTDSAGAVTGMVCVGTDISARKRAEMEREELRQQMIDSQRFETLGVLAGGVAHEFNNIMAVISGFTELALAKAANGGETLDYHLRVKKAVDHGRDIANRILEFSRFRAPALNAIVVSDLIDECAKLVQAITPSSIKVLTQVDPSCPRIHGDPHQLTQVVLNFVANSVHAIGGRQGRITIKASARSLDGTRVKSQFGVLKGDYVAIEVDDNGSGMDAHTQAKMFDPFFTTKPSGKGTGLGLSVAKAIIQHHGGAIDVNSKLGRGTTLSMYIPAFRRDSLQPRRLEEN